jgi:hypothetical protein
MKRAQMRHTKNRFKKPEWKRANATGRFGSKVWVGGRLTAMALAYSSPGAVLRRWLITDTLEAM